MKLVKVYAVKPHKGVKITAARGFVPATIVSQCFFQCQVYTETHLRMPN